GNVTILRSVSGGNPVGLTPFLHVAGVESHAAVIETDRRQALLDVCEDAPARTAQTLTHILDRPQPPPLHRLRQRYYLRDSRQHLRRHTVSESLEQINLTRCCHSGKRVRDGGSGRGWVGASLVAMTAGG